MVQRLQPSRNDGRQVTLKRPRIWNREDSRAGLSLHLAVVCLLFFHFASRPAI
jgi:hypothetical protein